MRYLSAKEAAEKWGISERSVRNYCASGRVDGAFLTGKTWNIPETAEKPARLNARTDKPTTLLEILQYEKKHRMSGGIYHRVQIDLTYNSNHIEGSRLTHDQTRYIFETATIGVTDEAVSVDDVVETVNHFRCIDFIIETAQRQLSEKYIKEIHSLLKSGTTDSRKDWFAVGDYKRFPNEVGGRATTAPEDVPAAMKQLLRDYNAKKQKTFDDLLDFHYRFERIHPFQDGNGRVGRLLLFKECLRFGIVPFIITDDLKAFYYRGLQNWETEQGYLRDTCGLAQDRFKKVLEYYHIICPEQFECVRRIERSARPGKLSSDSAGIEQWHRPN